MSFFGGEFFKKTFFKNEFFGDSFFQNSFFDDTTIAHPQEIEIPSTTSINLVCNRDITGVVAEEDFILYTNGSLEAVTGAVVTDNAVLISFDSPILDGQTAYLEIIANDANNLGVGTGHGTYYQPLTTKKTRKKKKVEG